MARKAAEKIKIQCWLNRDYPAEQAALQVLSWHEQRGRGVRTTVTQALNLLGGQEIDVDPDYRQIMLKLERLERTVNSRHEEMLAALYEGLRGLDLSQFVNTDGVSIKSAIENNSGKAIPDDFFSYFESAMFEGDSE